MEPPTDPDLLRTALEDHPQGKALADGWLAAGSAPLARLVAELPHGPGDPDSQLLVLLSAVLEELINHQEQQEEKLNEPRQDDTLQE